MNNPVISVRMTMNEAKAFFNPQPAIKHADRVQNRFMNRYGAFVRNDSRKSIRKRKAASQPGQPPSSHKGHLRNNIVYVVDRAASNVIIFPTVFRSAVDTPGKLERGGTIRIAKPLIRYMRGGRPIAANRKKRYKRGTVERVVTKPGNYRIADRPYMQPAKQRTDAKLDSIWAYARNVK